MAGPEWAGEIPVHVGEDRGRPPARLVEPPEERPADVRSVVLVDDLQLHTRSAEMARETLEVLHVLGPVARPARALDLEAREEAGLGQERPGRRRIVLEIAGALAELLRG